MLGRQCAHVGPIANLLQQLLGERLVGDHDLLDDDFLRCPVHLWMRLVVGARFLFAHRESPFEQFFPQLLEQQPLLFGFHLLLHLGPLGVSTALSRQAQEQVWCPTAADSVVEHGAVDLGAAQPRIVQQIAALLHGDDTAIVLVERRGPLLGR